MQFLYARYPYLTSSVVSFSSSGNNIVVALNATKRINIHRIWLVVAGATNLIFKNGTISLSGAVPMSTNGALTFDITGEPWFTASAGNDFIINSSDAVQVSGTVYYSLDK